MSGSKVERICKRGHPCFVGVQCKPCAAMYRRERRASDHEFKARTSAHTIASAKKRRAEEPRIRERQVAYHQAWRKRQVESRPGYLEEQREKTRQRRLDPDYRARELAKALESDRKRNQDPAFVARKLAYMKERFQKPETREKHRANDNRRRARLAGNHSPGISPSEWREVCAAHLNEAGDTACFYCGTACAVTIDHVVPIARGGRDEVSNVVPACKKCNSGKRDRLPHEWHRARELLGDRYEAFARRVLNYR